MNDKSFDTGDPHLRAALMRGLVSRRSAMMGAAGVGAAAFLAACGSAGKNPTTGAGGTGTAAAKTAAAAQDMSDTEKIVNWSNWPSTSTSTTRPRRTRPSMRSRRQTGIKVNYTEDYNDNDEFFAKVQPQLAGRPGHRSRRVVQHRLDGGPADPPRLGAEARPGQHPERTRTSRTP